MLEKEGLASEEVAGSRANRSCVEHVYSSGKILRSENDAGLTTRDAFFLTVQRPTIRYREIGCGERCGKLG